MYDTFMITIEAAIALRMAKVALLAITNDPSRTLEECIEERARLTHWILTESLPGIKAEWTDLPENEAISYWKDAALAAIDEIIFAGRAALERGELSFKVLSECLEMVSSNESDRVHERVFD